MTLTIKAQKIGKALICARRSAAIQPDDVARNGITYEVAKITDAPDPVLKK